jgi:hypothetical protein
MDTWLLAIQPWVFFWIAIVLFGLLGLLAYQKKAMSAFVVLLGAVFSSAFLYLDHISEIAATATSLTIKVREASDALVGLRKLAVLTGESIINLDSKVGAIGGESAVNRDRLKEQVLDVLRSINIDSQTLEKVANSDRDRNLSDYLAAVMNRVHNCVIGQGMQQSEWNEEWVKIDETPSAWPPSPEALRLLVNKYKITDSFALRIVAEYEHYFNTGQHQDLPFWNARETWPMFPISAGKCAD